MWVDFLRVILRSSEPKKSGSALVARTFRATIVVGRGRVTSPPDTLATSVDVYDPSMSIRLRSWTQGSVGVRLPGAAIVLALLATACGSGDSAYVARGGDLGHIHDLALADDGTLLVAAHTGLYRIESIDRAVLVGAEQHDLMAMTTDTDGSLLAGGHPDLRYEEYSVPDRPRFLGLARSDDEGESWEVVDLLGDADFHALAPSGGGLYAAETAGQIWYRDGEGAWSRLGSMEARDLAIDPEDSERQLAPAFDAVLWASSDGANTWAVVQDAPALIEVEWIESESIVGVDEAGTIFAASDPAGPWSELLAGPEGAETFWVDAEGRWWLTVHGGGVTRSDDNGLTWVDVYVPPER
jgi:hypothetical protein